jgi:hypothetical protein
VANQVAALRASLTIGNAGAPLTPVSGSTVSSASTNNTGAYSSSTSVEVNLDVPTSTSTPSSIVACDTATAIAFGRTVNQVHHIVYGSPTVGVSSGGFFPNGTNSIFKTTTA